MPFNCVIHSVMDDMIMTNNTHDTMPLITFCLLAYNQEAYIREAVLGALAQTYSPLEIILSDDCSSDRTFEIVREVTVGYRGPHLIKINRNDTNLGLVGHLNKVFAWAEGELVVFAAGDDVSLPERTQKLVSAWLEDRTVDAICSSYTKIDLEGKHIGTGEFRSFVPARQWLMTKRTFWFGCSTAYTKRLFTRFGPIAYNTTEDVVYYRRALLLGGVKYIAESLVKYRIGCGMSTKRMGAKAKAIQRNEWRSSLALQMLSDLAKVPETTLLLSTGAWWSRTLEWRLLFKNVLITSGVAHIRAYIVFLHRYPYEALLKISWLFR